MKLVVGLGNPGEKYSNFRHNLGFKFLDELVSSWQYEEKFKSEVANLDKSLLLVKPQTFINQSGIAVKLISDYYKVAYEDIIVIHDDLDLHLGKIKVRMGGSGGGHHGIESIIKHLDTDQFIRLRLGIGNEKSHSGEHKRISFSAEKFVLEPFLSNEKSQVKHMLKQAIKALNILLNKGLKEAQNQYN